MIPAFVIPLASALGGVLVRVCYELIRNRYQFKKELKDNNSIDVTGDDWHAAWQTSVENAVLINTERLSMRQKGNTVKVWNVEKSPENPKGGYRWTAQMQFFQGRSLMGWYFPLPEENNTSKGIMYFSYHSAKKTFYGKWIGSAYDGDLACGFLVISRDRSRSLEELNKLVSKHPDEVNIIFHNM